MAAAASAPALPFYDAMPVLVPIRAHEDRIFRITVCLRPFRMEGPRIEAERVGDKVVVHNYGHGGSGWSLSWGSSAIAVGKAMEAVAAAGGGKDVAVIGAGALGLTSAIVAATGGGEGDDLCEGAGALHAVVAGDGGMDAGLAGGVCFKGGAGVSGAVGGDGAELVDDVPELPGDGGESD